ncbi:hypothetical protein ACGFJ7_15775 [Actinoplanes sp. NPDC048988]|uniref:hypothetical protein n=1 Tax=Actinoplanes sp. NPDC048988 TaxID=3363901 RepID=UPI003710B5C6
MPLGEVARERRVTAGGRVAHDIDHREQPGHHGVRRGRGAAGGGVVIVAQQAGVAG